MRYFLVLLAVAGVVVSAFALHAHYSTRYLELPCDINSHWSCGLVNHSRYAVVLGVPVALIGILGYVLLGVVAWLQKRMQFMGLTIIALGIALHFTYIEAEVLHMWCLYCVISQGIIAVMTAFAIGWWIACRCSKPSDAASSAA
jgi:uncharacterized membrane protein